MKLPTITTAISISAQEPTVLASRHVIDFLALYAISRVVAESRELDSSCQVKKEDCKKVTQIYFGLGTPKLVFDGNGPFKND